MLGPIAISGRTRSGVNYAAVDEDAPRTMLGYFTLAMASVPRDAFPKKVCPRAASLRSAADLIGAARRGSAIRRPGTWSCSDFGSASACVWPMTLAVAASSQTPIGIASAGIPAMALCPSRVLRRRNHKGCFSTFGLSARSPSALKLFATIPDVDFNPPKPLH